VKACPGAIEASTDLWKNLCKIRRPAISPTPQDWRKPIPP